MKKMGYVAKIVYCLLKIKDVQKLKYIKEMLMCWIEDA